MTVPRQAPRYPHPLALLLALAGGLLAVGARAQESDRLRINGYSSFEFEKRLSDQGRADENGSFDADLFDLVFNIRASDRVRVAADVTWEHGPATEDGRGNVALEYAFAEYYAKDWLKLRAGKMFTAFGIYNEIHTAKPAFIPVKEPRATNNNTRLGGGFSFFPRWGTGLAVLGDVPAGSGNVDYVVQLTNGEQENTNPFEEDDNVQKALTARVRYKPTTTMSIGLSVNSDRLTELDAAGDDTGGRTSLTSWGAFVSGMKGGLGAELEYVQGELDPSASKSVRQHGLAALVYYRFKERYTPYLQYELLDPDRDRADDQAELVIYGLNVRIAEVLFLKAEINSQYSGKANSRFKGVDFHEFKGAIVVGF